MIMLVVSIDQCKDTTENEMPVLKKIETILESKTQVPRILEEK